MEGMGPNTLCSLPVGRSDVELGVSLEAASPPAIIAATAGTTEGTGTTDGSATTAVCVGAGAGCAALLVFFFCMLISKLASLEAMEPMVKDSTPTAHQQPIIDDVCIGNNEYVNSSNRLPIIATIIHIMKLPRMWIGTCITTCLESSEGRSILMSRGILLLKKLQVKESSKCSL